MDRHRYARLKEIFHAARGLPPEERAEYLASACEDDGELRAEAEGLLELDRAVEDDALDRALAGDGARGATPDAGVPKTIGRYRIVRICGSGGMGTVYEAEQDSPKRRVAVKVLQSGLVGGETLHRFRREAEILGRLQHPGIGQVFEAGEFELGGVTLPFFAMEYVEGSNLVRFAADHELTRDERVDLFARVCDAVGHAHQQGVVHRDLKPDNVLVQRATGTEGQPKILDFGVARLTDSDVHATLSTSAGQLLGSVPYMSPEQASASVDEIDARSDVYSLGVLLFELLTSRLPYEVEDRPLADALATIQRTEPLRLSACSAHLRGDLDTIVGTCLAKEPDRRYASVARLAEDLRRYRADQPIHARPPSTWYEIVKFTRRNRAVVAGTAATLAALTIGLIVATAFGLRAASSEARALDETYRSKVRAAEALISDDPLAARRILDSTAEQRRGWESRYLEACLSPALLEFGTHFPESPLVAVDQGLLAGRDDRTLSLWNPHSGEELETWTSPTPVSAWGMSPDGRLLAAGALSGSVFVLDRSAPNGEWVLWLEGTKPVTGLEFSPDGSHLAVARAESLQVGQPGRWSEMALGTGWGEGVRIAFHPDGERLALLKVASHSTRISLHTVRDLGELAVRHAPEGTRCLRFIDDGARLICGSAQRSVELIDANTLERLDRWLGHSKLIFAVDDHPTGFLTASLDETLRIWSRDGATKALFPVPGIDAAIFLSDARAVTAAQGRLQLWDLDAEARRVLRGHDSYVYELAFSGDGSLLASHAPFPPTEAIVWDLFDASPLARLDKALGSPSRMILNVDGQLELRTDHTHQLYPWYGAGPTLDNPPAPVFHDWSYSRRALRTARQEYPLDDPTTTTIYRTVHVLGDEPQTRMFADGAELAANARDQKRWCGEHPRLFVGNRLDRDGAFNGSITDLLVYAGQLSDGRVRSVEDYLAARRTGEDRELPKSANTNLLAHFRADRRALETTTVTVKDAPREQVETWTASNDPGLVLKGHGVVHSRAYYRPADSERAEGVVFENLHRSRRWLEAAFPQARGVDALTVFWLGHHSAEWPGGALSTAYSIGSLPSYETLWPASQAGVRRVGVVESYDTERRLHALSRDGHNVYPIVRDDRTGEVLIEIEKPYFVVGLSADGRRLACGTITGRLDVYDARTGALLGGVDAHAGEIYCVEWAPDGSFLASGGNDNVARLWDADTLAPLLELRGHEAYVKALAFSPDGTLLATASGDTTIRLWDSLPASERHARNLALQRLREEVAPRVAEWLGESPDPEAVADRIRATWPAEDPRRQAALVQLAKAHAPR